MSKEKKWNFIAPCGLYCAECTAFLNTECGGCRTNEGLSKEFRKYCKIYMCSSTKKFKICLECGEFPCRLFNFFKAETLDSSSWFLDIWANMKQINELGLTVFLKSKKSWLEKRKKCAQRRGVGYCDQCERWPCELLKRPTLVPVDLKGFKEFMQKTQ